MSENSKWFNQTLLTHKDKIYATDGYLRVGITTNSENYSTFNPPMFVIAITNTYQKNCSLNIQNAEDLLDSFNLAIKQLNGHESVIEKKYQKNTSLYFKFTIETSSNQRVVVIDLISNESDSCRIIVPLKPTFQSFLRRLKYFVENYDSICMSLLNSSINSEAYQIIFQLPNLIKGISSQIYSQIPVQDKNLDVISDTRAVALDAKSDADLGFDISDLDKFMGDNLENISIPDLDEKKPPKEEVVVEIKSDFVTKVLDNNLFNLENKLISFSASRQPFLDIKTDLQKTLGFELLPGIDEHERKSLIYISSILYKYHSKMYTISDVPIPSGTPSLKYKSKNPDENNINLAKDLLLIIGYMRTVRRKLESKVSNAYENKSMAYLSLRCFLDPLCFSFIENMSKDEIVSSLKNRFLYFDKIGFFDKYKQLLKDFNCPAIDLQDLNFFADETFEKNVGKTQFILELHEMFCEKDFIKLPTKNEFNLEQIINQFIPLDINNMLGFDFKNKEKALKIKEEYNVEDEVFKFFIDKKISTSKMIVREKITPLQRMIDKFKQDIPERFQEEVMTFVKELEYKKIDMSELAKKWPLIEFDERVIKAFYLWDTEANTDIKTNFNLFASLIENEPMAKENILALATVEVKTNSAWDEIKL